jgi:hypothetical protein
MIRALIVTLLLASFGRADDSAPAAVARATDRWALILAGLPGDEAHDAEFRLISNRLRAWLIESLAFPQEQVLVLPDRSIEAEASPPLTAELIRSTLHSLSEKLPADGTLWFFTLGHGSYDGKRAWFHVAGRDPSDLDLAGWLSAIRCREQVLWLTHSSSGWMVKALARPERIVIAATAADDEPNETEFPQALVAVSRRSPTEIPRRTNGRLTVADLYSAVIAEVERRFKADNRLPTEHAQIDDNGDGQGSELIDETTQAEGKPPSKRDGDLARATLVPDVRLTRTSGPKSQNTPRKTTQVQP